MPTFLWSIFYVLLEFFLQQIENSRNESAGRVSLCCSVKLCHHRDNNDVDGSFMVVVVVVVVFTCKLLSRFSVFL